MAKTSSILRDNSLSLALFGLFLCCMAGDAVAGWMTNNQMLAEHHHRPLGLGAYLLSGPFLQGLAVNWQAAVLQLATLIIFSGLFFQRGAPHSRNPDRPRQKHRSRNLVDWIWRRSLSLAFGALFLATFAVDIFSGAAAFNQHLALHGEAPLGVANYLASSTFWSATLQTWQAEYLVIAVYLVLSIFLRQDNSAESKPPDDSDDATGEHNE
jgi:hypothetical protein